MYVICELIHVGKVISPRSVDVCGFLFRYRLLILCNIIGTFVIYDIFHFLVHTQTTQPDRNNNARQ
jgi:hypothetical protein